MTTSSALTPSARLARLVESLFDRWELTERERDEVLIYDMATVRNKLCGDDGGADEALVVRISQLLQIHRILRTLFPNRDLAYAWIKRPNRAFDSRTPLSLICQDGAVGINRIIHYLASALDR